MRLNPKEKRLLLIAGLMFLGYFLPFYVLPAVSQAVYHEWEHYQDVQSNIQRYQRLRDQTQIWQERHTIAQQSQKKVKAGTLSGSTRELVAAKLQGILKQHAQESGVLVKALDVPEFAATQDWLMVTQVLHFQANSQSAFKFLQALQEDAIILPIVELDLRTFRVDQMNGRIKITGFSLLSASDNANPIHPPNS
jgi:hypothetical protein